MADTTKDELLLGGGIRHVTVRRRITRIGVRLMAAKRLSSLWTSHKKTVANWIFAQTTHVAGSKSMFVCWVASSVLFYISSFIKIGSMV